MEKGLGIGAIVVAILAIFVPVVTVYVVWAALAIATLAALLGDKVSPVVTLLITVVNVIFLSPMTLALLKGENMNGGSFYLIFTIVLAVAPIVGMVVYAKRASSNPIESAEGEV